MTDESALALAAGPEPVTPAEATEAPEGQVKDQTADTSEGEQPEKVEEKSEAAKRREREKAYKEKLREQAALAEDARKRAEQRLEKITQAKAAAAPPVEADFSDYADFIAAKAVWTYTKQAIERDASEAGSDADEARSRAAAIKAEEDRIVARAWAGQVQDAKSRYPDFDKVALDESVPISEPVARLLQTSEMGADVAYYLGMNRAVAAELSRMPAIEAARAIGRIEATLQAPKPRTETQAPSPINPVRGSAGAAKNPANMNPAEYRAWREAGGKI